MTGASVHLVRLLGTMVLLSVGSATAVLAGCLSSTVDYESPDEATTKGKKFEKVCREVFDRERE